MKKDIDFHTVEDVLVAVVKETKNNGEQEWNVYLINRKNEPIENVFVTSTGYGNISEEHKKTSTLRHFFELLPAYSGIKVEPIMEEVFGLANEYWVSFYLNNQIFEKKFIFLPDSILESNFTKIPVIEKHGVLIG